MVAAPARRVLSRRADQRRSIVLSVIVSAVGDLHDLTMLEQASAIRDASISPVDLVEHYLERIDRLNDDVGAFVFLAPDLAREAARVAAQAVVDGAELGALHGVPTGIKDLYATADMPTGFGTGAFPPMHLGQDEAFVTKLRAAGMISLGKTATPEFGAPCYGGRLGAPARSPWERRRRLGTHPRERQRAGGDQDEPRPRLGGSHQP